MTEIFRLSSEMSLAMDKQPFFISLLLHGASRPDSRAVGSRANRTDVSAQTLPTMITTPSSNKGMGGLAFNAVHAPELSGCVLEKI